MLNLLNHCSNTVESLMAELKSTPSETPKEVRLGVGVRREVIRAAKLSALLSSTEGESFFGESLKDHSLYKYWDFYKFVEEKILQSKNQEEQLNLIKQCFEEHISYGGACRVEACFNDADDVKNFSKSINERNCEDLEKILKGKKQSALHHLEQEFFLPHLLPEIKKATPLKTPCDLL